MSEQITHAEMVRRSGLWLEGRKRCRIILLERIALIRYIPDAVGFTTGGESILIECKVSRSDFKADKNKIYHRISDLCIGNYRYYMVPEGLVKPNEVPETWGLLEVRRTMIRVLKESKRHVLDEKAQRIEREFLVSEIIHAQRGYYALTGNRVVHHLTQEVRQAGIFG